MFKDLHGALPSQSHGRFRDPLEFPKTGLGAQCDINFSAHLALQNTALLRCYALTDPRVKPMILFVKHWAKARGINSGYRGTLSSYGYVLMVLHYLVHIAQPFVCPNLQRLPSSTWPGMPPAEAEAMTTCKGYDVQFWRNEQEILQLAMVNQLNQSMASLGDLLRGFFEYFAQSGAMSTVPKRGFDWGRDVLSLRSHGGLLSKQEKGWTGAKTVYAGDGGPAADAGQPGDPSQASSRAQPGATGENDQQSRTEQSGAKNQHIKEIRLRYLFAIEDPFELDHNVARTVTHNGIVSIRDEFRRAWRIIQASGGGNNHEELLADVKEIQESSDDVSQLLEDIHGCLDASHA
ncbi:Poly(A) RNA polymerase protein cid1 [Escovopsis weberi]|uniref:Poly(A) RNA polymerase protein cid1 n=1 Tax=Escovopsis weberi TaxID=150374 RepID=A0A0M8N5Z3_ESCWE|nr:Poly(A) RNA polymerase protein cid1 [Escovopsis weberi]